MHNKKEKNSANSFISLFILIICLFPLTNAQDIAFSYPNILPINTPFNVSLNLIGFSQSNYSIKVEILGSNEKRISQIYSEGKWKSTFYYAGYTYDGIFTMRIVNTTSSNANFLIKIKDSKNKIYTFNNYTAIIANSQDNLDSISSKQQSTILSTKHIKSKDNSFREFIFSPKVGFIIYCILLVFLLIRQKYANGKTAISNNP